MLSPASLRSASLMQGTAKLASHRRAKTKSIALPPRKSKRPLQLFRHCILRLYEKKTHEEDLYCVEQHLTRLDDALRKQTISQEGYVQEAMNLAREEDQELLEGEKKGLQIDTTSTLEETKHAVEEEK